MDFDTNVADFELVQGLDQTLPMDKAQRSILEKVDTLLEIAVERQDPEMVARAMRSLLGVGRIAGLALSKSIYTMKFQWKNFKRHEDFFDWAEENIGRGKTTIKRYFEVWEMLVEKDIPREYTEKLQLHPIKSLIPMAALLDQGYEVEDHQWKKLADAPDVSTVNKLCREIKGVPAKKGSLQIEMEADGTINCWMDGKKYYVGFMNVDDNNEVVQKAIARIMSDKILEK